MSIFFSLLYSAQHIIISRHNTPLAESHKRTCRRTEFITPLLLSLIGISCYFASHRLPRKGGRINYSRCITRRRPPHYDGQSHGAGRHALSLRFPSLILHITDAAAHQLPGRDARLFPNFLSSLSLRLMRLTKTRYAIAVQRALRGDDISSHHYAIEIKAAVII